MEVGEHCLHILATRDVTDFKTAKTLSSQPLGTAAEVTRRYTSGTHDDRIQPALATQRQTRWFPTKCTLANRSNAPRRLPRRRWVRILPGGHSRGETAG
jgi:hypothetical protein